MRAVAIRVKGQGLGIKTTKTDAGTSTLALPQWCITMLRRRAATAILAEDKGKGQPVFPAPLGGWRDPSNTQADLRQALHERGLRLGDLPRLPQDRSHRD